VTDVGLRELRDLTALTQLGLTGCTRVTDVGVRKLRGLPALTHLSLSYCTNMTDVGLQHLSSFTALNTLYGPERAQGCPPRPHHSRVIDRAALCQYHP